MKHPRTVRMMTDGLEQKLPIDAVEEALDVEIEHPVVAPTALARLVHGIERRCNRRSRRGTPAPKSAPGSVGQPPEQHGQQPSECLTVACSHSPSESRPAASFSEPSVSFIWIFAKSRIRKSSTSWPAFPLSHRVGQQRQQLESKIAEMQLSALVF